MNWPWVSLVDVQISCGRDLRIGVPSVFAGADTHFGINTSFIPAMVRSITSYKALSPSTLI